MVPKMQGEQEIQLVNHYLFMISSSYLVVTKKIVQNNFKVIINYNNFQGYKRNV